MNVNTAANMRRERGRSMSPSLLELFTASNSLSDDKPDVVLDNAAVTPSSASNPQSGSGSAPLPSVPSSSVASSSPSSSATESASAIVSAPENVTSAVSSVPKDDPSPAPTGSTSVITSSTPTASPSVTVSQKAPGPTSDTVSSSTAPAVPNNVAVSPSSSHITSSRSVSKSESFVTDAPTSSATTSLSSSPSSVAPTSSHSAASSSASGPPKSTPKVSSAGPTESTSTSTTVVITRHAQTSVATTSSTIRASQSPTASTSSPASVESKQTGLARLQPTEPVTSGSAASEPSISINPGNSFVGSVHTSSTTRADTTLSTPVSVTTTESSGKAVVTAPALITSLSVTTGTNGVPQTHTSVFANPTSASDTESLNEKTFWDNKGTVAGVFIVVALAILASVLGTFICCRRRRQRRAHDMAVSEDMSRRDIFEQPVTYQAAGRRGIGFDFIRDDPQRYLMAPSFTSGASVSHEESPISRHSSDNHISALGLSGIPANSRKAEHASEDPFSDYHRHIPTADNTRQIVPTESHIFPIKHSADSKLERTSAPVDRPPSLAPSTPSIYPPSLPAVPEKDEDDYLFYERETQRRPLSQVSASPPKAFMDDESDPRNPFYLEQDAKVERETHPPQIQTGQAYRPLTPPDSFVGHSALPSPTTSQSSHVETETVRPLNPFSGAFLGRPVSAKIEPLPRPMRSPLRVSSPSLRG